MPCAASPSQRPAARLTPHARYIILLYNDRATILGGRTYSRKLRAPAEVLSAIMGVMAAKIRLQLRVLCQQRL